MQWLSTVRGFDGPGSGLEPDGKWRETLSWSRYQRTHDLAWLMAAASLVPVAATNGDKREAELDRLIRKLRQAEEEVAKLAGEQERLQKKMQEAGKIADPARREEEVTLAVATFLRAWGPEPAEAD